MKISCQSCGAKYNIADEKVRGKIVKIACKKCGARIEIDGREPAEQAQDQDETRVFDQPGAGGGGGTWTASIDDNDQREVTTAQLVELYQQGVITADTFVWRDGMADWQAVRDVADLQSALSGASRPLSAPPAAYSEPPTAAYPQPEAPAPAFSGPAAGGYGTPAIETAQAARLGGSRRGGSVDLFAQSAHEEEDVATRAPATPAPGAMAGAPAGDGGKPLGARNENSVLFSLSALTASGPSTAAAAAPEGGDEKSGLIDIQKLAAAAKPGNGAKDDRAKLDDIMNLGGGGAFGSALGAPILAPPPAAALSDGPVAMGGEGEKKSNKTLVIALAFMGVVIVALVLVLVLRKGDDTTASKDKDKSAETAEKKDDKKDDKDKVAAADKTAAAAPTDTTPTAGSAAPPPDTTGGPIGKPGSAPPGGAVGKPGAAPPPGGAAAAPDKTAAAPADPGGAKKPCKTLEECMGGAGAPPPPKKEDPPAAAGGGEIDKGAVKSALGGVPYKDCGSGGAGKVQVTFGPNGNVTSAVVTGGDYDGGTKSCIQNRFKSAKVPAYGGAPKSFAWSINL
jgi:predicted Zn finger-like uncharacterized protein